MKATQVWCLPVTFLFFSIFQHTGAQGEDIKWPKYSQQCQDDAGPPFQDDSETYPNGKYHDGTPAYAVLPPDGKCPDPMKEACQDRPDIKTAYIEGPINCGKQGWYCRMTRDENFNDYNLKGDYNMGHCNSTDGFESEDFYDGDGHCHGSSKDNTYYWWVRDHWFRQYNGHVRCCCGWYKSEDYPYAVHSRRITNRCDYRRQLPKSEDETKCRDANEEHGLSFEGGCIANDAQIGKPIKEDDAQCWEIALFGNTKNDDDNDDSGDGDDDSSDGDDDVEEECIQTKNQKFAKKNKKGKVVGKKCSWLEKKSKKIRKKHCKKKIDSDKFGPAKEVCPITCGICTPEEDSEEEDSEGENSEEDSV